MRSDFPIANIDRHYLGAPGLDQRLFRAPAASRSVLPICLAIGFSMLAATVPVRAQGAQDMMQYLDLSSPPMTEAEVTREDVAAVLQAG